MANIKQYIQMNFEQVVIQGLELTFLSKYRNPVMFL